MNKKAFTLVELIVVITIVGILSTVGFVSYSNYLTGARDSNRISQMIKLSDSLQVYAATKSLPLPDNKVDITASGTIIAYQGYAGNDVLETIDYTNGGKDPKDESYFTYYVTKDRKKMQLLAFMEENQTLITQIPQSYATDYEERYPKVYGSKLGVLLSADLGTLNRPIQENPIFIGSGYVDISSTTNTYKILYDDITSLIGSGNQVITSIAVRNKFFSNLDPNLVGYWDMETTTSDGKLKDFSKYGNNGVCYEALTPVACGTLGVGPQFIEGNERTGRGMDFDGVNDWIKSTFTNTYAFSGAISIIAKVKLSKVCTTFIDGDPCIDTIVYKGGSSNPGFWLMANYVGEKYLTEINGNAGGFYDTSMSKNIHNVWTNVYFIKNNDSNTYFINGVIDKKSIFTYNQLNNVENLSIGAAFNMNDRVFDGIIDEIRIYNRALSDSEIKLIYLAMK